MLYWFYFFFYSVLFMITRFNKCSCLKLWEQYRALRGFYVTALSITWKIPGIICRETENLSFLLKVLHMISHKNHLNVEYCNT